MPKKRYPGKKIRVVRVRVRLYRFICEDFIGEFVAEVKTSKGRRHFEYVIIPKELRPRLEGVKHVFVMIYALPPDAKS